MKHFYRLNGWQWFGVVVWTALSLRVPLGDSAFFIVLRLACSFVIGYGLVQWQIQQQVYPLTLIVKASGGRNATEADRELFDKLDALFQSAFPIGSLLTFAGFDCNDEQLWFYFKGADPDVIMKAIQPLVKDISLPPGSHLLVLTGPNQTKELPVFATV